MKLSHLIAAGALAVTAAFVPGTAPAGANVVAVDVNRCSVGPSNGGQCTMIVLSPGTYTLTVVSDADWVWADVTCPNTGGFISVTFNGPGSDSNSGRLERGVCTLTLIASGGVATASI